MEPLPERGRLAETPLPRLLLALERDRFGGRLILARGRVTKRIRLRQGAPIHAESSRPSESLVVALRESGALDDAQAERVTARAREREVREEAVLLELGLLAPRDLLAALRDHAGRLLLDCFAWDDAEFTLEAGDVAASEATLLRLEPVRLALAGIASHWPPERTFAALGEKLGRYPVAVPEQARPIARLDPSSPTRRLLESLDGQRTLDQAIRSAASADAVAAAWVLDAAGALAYRNAAVMPGATAEPEPAEAPQTEAEFEIVVARANAPDPRAAKATTVHPPASPPGATSNEAEALQREIDEKQARLDELDYYDLLGVARDAKPTTVKRAYFSAAKRFHPDVLSRLGLEALKPRASEVFARMAKAYDVLSDYDQRRDYDASLGEGGDEAEAARLVQAETLFRKGEILLRGGNFAGALEFLGPAVQLWPDDCTYQSTLGWAIFRSSPKRAKDALPHLERAIELDPRDAAAHQRLGAVLRALGQDAAAERAFARARQLDPKSTS